MSELKDLKEVCREIRELTLGSIYSIGKGHVGGCMSIVEVLATLYFEEMNIDPAEPKKAGRDRLIVSKGHAGPAVYATLAARGYFPREELLTLNKVGTNLPSHCDMNKTTGIDMTTGSLGQGFSCAVGVAVGSKLSGDGATIYTIIGDGESQEGQIWEAAMFAAHRGLDNLIAFTDANRMQIDGMVDEVCSLGDLDAQVARLRLARAEDRRPRLRGHTRGHSQGQGGEGAPLHDHTQHREGQGRQLRHRGRRGLPQHERDKRTV